MDHDLIAAEKRKLHREREEAARRRRLLHQLKRSFEKLYASLQAAS